MTNEKWYAQLDENNICTCVSTHKTDLEATITNLGQRWVKVEETEEVVDPETGAIFTVVVRSHWEWQNVEKPNTPNQPTNAEVAQMISDLQADLIIAGVI